MIVVSKKGINFSMLNRLCKRSAEATLDTNKMATAVPAPAPGSEIFFSCLDAWNGYYLVSLEELAKIYFGFLTEFGTYRYQVAPQGQQVKNEAMLCGTGISMTPYSQVPVRNNPFYNVILLKTRYNLQCEKINSGEERSRNFQF